MSSTSGNAQEPRWLSEAIADVVVTAVAGEWGAAGSRHGRIHRPTEASAAAGLARRPGFVDRLSRLVDPAVRGSLTLGHQLVESWKAPGSPEPGHVRVPAGEAASRSVMTSPTAPASGSPSEDLL